MFLAEKGIDRIERVQVDVAAGEARRAACPRENALGEVPVLELDDGSYIREAPPSRNSSRLRGPSPRCSARRRQSRQRSKCG
jgi:hypothetical protein